MLRYAQVAIRMSSIPRAGRGATRRNLRAHPYHASSTRTSPAAATAVKPVVAEPQPASSSVEVLATHEPRRHFSDQTFADAPISQASKLGIKHKYLSDVQAATLELALAGKDLLVQAKTGTGKTMAFLLPTVERLAKLSQRPPQGQISVLILSPTRELALQIEEEAKTLLAHHPFQAQHAIGGTNINSEKNRLKHERCDILIATPGRLLDHLENGHVESRLANVQTLILDEADRLLDQGFLNDLEKIFTFLPSRKQVPRQAMLFSATMSSEVKQVVRNTLSGDHTFVSTLTKEEANTHEHVPQSVTIAPLSDTLATTLAVVRDDIATHGKASKIMIFCPTARSTALSAEVFRQIKGLPPILEIHSRKTQANRSKAAEAFKDAKTSILFSSDVAARGMDFPGVTLVIQAGLPSSAEQYVHRLGRTARAGASGRGILILSSFEKFFLQQKEVKTFNIRYHKELSSLPQTEIDAALQMIDQSTKAQAYVAWMGYYSSWLKKMNLTSTQLVEMANAYVMEVLFYRGNAPPPILAKTVGMMGLRGVPGLHIVKSKEQLVHPE